MLTVNITVNGRTILMYGAKNTSEEKAGLTRYDVYQYQPSHDSFVREKEPFAHAWHRPQDGAAKLAETVIKTVMKHNRTA